MTRQPRRARQGRGGRVRISTKSTRQNRASIVVAAKAATLSTRKAVAVGLEPIDIMKKPRRGGFYAQVRNGIANIRV
jgi:hypothetical protein